MIELKVLEALKKDVGRGLVRLDSKTRKALDVETGEVVEITGKKNAIAVVWPAHPQDEGLSIIRMDGYLRQNAGVSLGDKVQVKKAELKIAKKVSLSPPNGSIKISPGFYSYIKNKIIGRPCLKGNIMIIPIFSTIFPVLVDSTTPSGPVMITESTEIILNEEPSKEKKQISSVTYEEIGGLKEEIKKIREMVELPMRYPELFEKLGIEPPKGVLLYGNPGTGKTMLAKAVANETDANFIYLAGPEIVSKYVGESEQKLRQIFKQAEENAPTIIFLDEIDAIAPSRENTTGEVERRMVSQLLTLMDGMKTRGQVIVIAATNRENAIDPALRRPGRFDREIEIGIPNRNARREILHIHTRNMPIDLDFSQSSVLRVLRLIRKSHEKNLKKYVMLAKKNAEKYEEKKSEAKRNLALVKKIYDMIEKAKNADKQEIEEICKYNNFDFADIKQRLLDEFLADIANTTHGYTGADLSILVKEAAMNSLRRLVPKIENLDSIPQGLLEDIKVTKEDFKNALREIRPSALREVFVERPNISWSDIGGMEKIKNELKEAVELAITKPEVYQKMGIRPIKGMLLIGPPGSGKTLLSKAVASQTQANFISIKGPEILSKWVGESEKAIREIFRKARISAPCVILIDEIDSIASKRGNADDSKVIERVVNSLLTEMDGLSDLKQVFVIGTTNRPDIIDPALLRSGRFDKIIEISLPDEKTRLEIFKIHTHKMPVDAKTDLEKLAKITQGYSGADIENICREAGMLAIREGKNKVSQKHFENAINEIMSSVRKDDLNRIDKFNQMYG